MFLDIGVGILVSIFVSWILAVPLGTSLLLAGIIGALLPDIDFIIHLLRGGNTRNDLRHRDLLHFPILFVPVVFLVVAVFDIQLAIAASLGSLMHFIHDSIGIGWGIQWLYPFHHDHFSFFYIYNPKYKERLPRKLFYRWKHHSLEELDDRFGDNEWIRNIYLQWHPYAVVELAVFIGALVGLYFYQFS